MGRGVVAFQVTRFKTLGGPKRSWEDNIIVDLQGLGWGGLDFIDMAEDRNRLRTLVDVVVNFRMPINVGNFLNS
jgi:hypothetical protein